LWRGSLEIIKFTGEGRDGNLVLTGSCAQCGQKVARVVETSQVDASGNLPAYFRGERRA
jgi:hypothetical protein